MNNIGVAMIGTGFMGAVHVEALRRVGVNVIGICGSSAEKSQRAAEQLALGTAYTDYSQVLTDPQVQSVHIGTPNRWHFSMVEQALAAGKHVMCEKPLAVTTEESSRLVQLAAQNPHLACGVNYNIRFYPLCIEMAQRIASPTWGRSVHITGCYVQDWLVKQTDYNWRVLTKDNGPLRAVADIGTHWMDLVSAVTGLQVEAVCADLQTVHPVRHRPTGEVETFQNAESGRSTTEPVSIETEDYGVILLRFSGGTKGCLHVSQVAPGKKNALRLEIAGTHQSLGWESERPNELWIGHRDQPNEVLIKDPALLSAPAAGAAGFPGGHNEGYGDSFKQCFQRFYEFIGTGDSGANRSFPTFADGHREVVLCEAILKSHQQQSWVTVSE